MKLAQPNTGNQLVACIRPTPMTRELYRRLLTKLPIPGCSHFVPQGLPHKVALAGDRHVLSIQELREFLTGLGIEETDIEIVYGVRPKNTPFNRYVVLLPKPRD